MTLTVLIRVGHRRCRLGR